VTLRSRAIGFAALGVLLFSIAPGAAAPKPKKYTITIVDAMHYEPASLTVRAGDTITWVNKDIVQHTATSAEAGFDSPAISPEKSWTYTARKKGAFAYNCRFHPLMKGSLTIR
jgi:plastocyanin